MDRHREPKYKRGMTKEEEQRQLFCTNQVLQALSHHVIFFVMKSQTGLVSKGNSPGDVNGTSLWGF